MIDLFKKVHRADGTIINEMHIPAGYAIGKHVHPYTHHSIQVSGKSKLTVGGKPAVILDGFQVVTIPAYESHVIEAIEPTIWTCIHSQVSMNDADQLKLVGG